MIDVLTAGEILVEIMRDKAGTGLGSTGIFKGPYASGAPAIFIDASAKLGHRSAIVGGVGNDDFGDLCINRLKEDGVDISWIKRSNRPTGVAFVAYSENGDRKFIYHIRDSAASDTGDISIKELREVKMFHIMGCSIMVKKEMAEKIVKYAKTVKKSGGMVSFDPNIRVELMDMDYIRKMVEDVINLTDIILPGLKELKLLTNTEKKSDAVEKILKKAKILVLKQGKKGCEIFSSKQKKSIIVPSFQIREVDPTGAGDAFDAGFVCAYLEGKDLKDCGVLANACGAMNTTRLGPMEGIKERKEIYKFIREKSDNIAVT